MLYGILRKQDDALLAIIEAGSEVSAVGFGQELHPVHFGRVAPHDDSGRVAMVEALAHCLTLTGMPEAEATAMATSTLESNPVGPAVPHYIQTASGKIESVTA